MSTQSETALQLFRDGCNCCQAVIAAASEDYGLPPEIAIAMGAAFGGGMRKGEVCGAVAGALMLLGLRHGARNATQQDRKKAANDRTAAYMTAFQERYGSYLCREILKANGKRICETLVPGALELLNELDAAQDIPERL